MILIFNYPIKILEIFTTIHGHLFAENGVKNLLNVEKPETLIFLFPNGDNSPNEINVLSKFIINIFKIELAQRLGLQIENIKNAEKDINKDINKDMKLTYKMY